MVWLHSGQRDLGPPSRQPGFYGVGEGGSNSPGCSGLIPRTFNKVSEAQVRQWAMGDTVSLGFLLPPHSPLLGPSLVAPNTRAVILDPDPFPVCHYGSSPAQPHFRFSLTLLPPPGMPFTALY